MATEIERKYLVTGDFMKQVVSSHTIKQGYLSFDPERTIRVRLSGKQGFLTIKGKQSGISRFEWEKEIDYTEAKILLGMSIGHIIEKTRHIVPLGEFKVEIDIFHGENEGLIIAEIELISESDKPLLPSWIGKDVSSDLRYHNSYLSQKPFRTW